MENSVLNRHIGKYMRVYIKNEECPEEGDITETGFLKYYDKDWIEMDYPAFLKKSEYCVAPSMLIPIRKIKYIDILYKKAVDYHRKDFKEKMKELDEDDDSDVNRLNKHNIEFG